MKKQVPFSLLFFVLLFVSFNSFAQTHFTATLTGQQENPAVATTAIGTGVFLLTDAGLEFSITVDSLDFTAAHFHNAAPGANGGVVRNIGSDFIGNTASGIWKSTDAQPLTAELIAALLAGNIYVNVHTAANPGGEIRGQLNVSAGTSFTASLNGIQQNPAVTTAASGTGFFTLTDAGLVYAITVEGLEMTNAHFHKAGIGANGGVSHGIFDKFVGNRAFGVWTSSDAQPLTDDLITDLLLGNIYVNAHSAANPGGEIRGQVLLNGGMSFTADLSGSQENPAVETDASGTGAFTLTDAGLIYSITITGLEFTAAHFHNAAAGSNGGVVRNLAGSFTGNTARGVWKSSDAQPLTDDLIAELLKGNIYVNAHTAANPGGEIRGQINLNTGVSFAAHLSGNQQNPAVTSDASGTGYFTLTDTGLVFAITLDGLEIANAHFHGGVLGANGGVVRGIASDFVNNTARGVWKATDAQPLTVELLAALLSGNLYINAHTAANPGGEIRGQVLSNSGTSFGAQLTGDQENPAVVTDAGGTGSFLLTDAGLIFAITVNGLEVSNAHFHSGELGTNGGVVRAILNDFVGNTAVGIWSPLDAQPLTPELIGALLAGKLYINAHTAANPGGEIRGQVLLNGGKGLSAKLMGTQENPPVTTAASGTGAFTLTDAGLVFNLTVSGLDFTAAHFHNAPIGSNGGVVRNIGADFVNHRAAGVWSGADAQALTDSLMGELVLGNIYVNVHTADNPGGEIRGQLSPFDFTTSVESIESLTNEAEVGQLLNFPNPFKQSTEIQFELKQAAQTTLKIYNSVGQEVATLLNEKMQTGLYKVTFESRNLPAGIYFSRLESAGQSAIGKMMLVK